MSLVRREEKIRRHTHGSVGDFTSTATFYTFLELFKMILWWVTLFLFLLVWELTYRRILPLQRQVLLWRALTFVAAVAGWGWVSVKYADLGTHLQSSLWQQNSYTILHCAADLHMVSVDTEFVSTLVKIPKFSCGSAIRKSSVNRLMRKNERKGI